MTKTIIAVYQDCMLCGANKEKGDKMLADLAKAGASFRKLSFATMEGREYCMQAIEAGVKTMPFFTDGTNFASDYKELLQAESEPHTLKIKAEAEPKKTKRSRKNGHNAKS